MYYVISENQSVLDGIQSPVIRTESLVEAKFNANFMKKVEGIDYHIVDLSFVETTKTMEDMAVKIKWREK